MMKTKLQAAGRNLVRFLAPHVGLGVFDLPEFEFSNDAEDLDWNSEELPPDPSFLTAERITIH